MCFRLSMPCKVICKREFRRVCRQLQVVLRGLVSEGCARALTTADSEGRLIRRPSWSDFGVWICADCAFGSWPRSQTVLSICSVFTAAPPTYDFWTNQSMHCAAHSTGSITTVESSVLTVSTTSTIPAQPRITAATSSSRSAQSASFAMTWRA